MSGHHYHHHHHHSRNDSFKREHDDNSNDSREDRKRKRKSRWGNNESDKVVIPGLPTIIPSNLSKEQEEMCLLTVQIEGITYKLRSGDLGMPEDPEQRSPSPEPVYNSDRKRLNTREFRVRKKLEEERHQLITQMINLNPLYKAPLDYKPPQTKLSDKVLIPQEEYPDINFVGLLIGPRGNTLKAMEKDTGAKIIIRGKGSIKEGKIGRKDGQPLPGEDEPLHAFLTAPTDSAIQAATKQIMKIIKQAIELPENQNNLRRTQLRELALLNGTLRENDSISKRFCSNCGSVEHRNWQCPEKQNMVNTMHCNKCNGKGHLEKDCKFVANENGDSPVNSSKIDEEYFSFMAELGECSPLPAKAQSDVGSSSSVPNSTTTATDGGPLALGYDKISSSDAQSINSNQNGSSSNGQALLPTPSNSNSSSSSDKKTVTWIQKQGQWKQVIQDTPEASNDQTIPSSTADSSSSNNSSSTNNNNTAASIASDPMALQYYNAYLQQPLAAGQDYNTALATAQSAYEAYVAYAYHAAVSSTASSTTVATDTSNSSSKYSQAYNAVPPTTQLSVGATSVSDSTASSSYGYGAMPPNSTAANYSAYAAYYGMGSTIPPAPASQPPHPPE